MVKNSSMRLHSYIYGPERRISVSLSLSRAASETFTVILYLFRERVNISLACAYDLGTKTRAKIDNESFINSLSRVLFYSKMQPVFPPPLHLPRAHFALRAHNSHHLNPLGKYFICKSLFDRSTRLISENFIPQSQTRCVRWIGTTSLNLCTINYILYICRPYITHIRRGRLKVSITVIGPPHTRYVQTTGEPVINVKNERQLFRCHWISQTQNAFTF